MKTIIEWGWEEAFYKFGFGDGDGPNFTEEVANFLMGEGYDVDCRTWGMHNYMIMDIKRDGVSIMPDEAEHSTFQVGYSDPREWLPKDLIKKLDKEFA